MFQTTREKIEHLENMFNSKEMENFWRSERTREVLANGWDSLLFILNYKRRYALVKGEKHRLIDSDAIKEIHGICLGFGFDLKKAERI